MRMLMAAVAIWLPTASLSAQDRDQVTPGTRVRVTAESALVQLPTGTYRTSSDSTLVSIGIFQSWTDTALELSSGNASFTIPVASIVRLERSRGERPGAGARITGFVLGAAIGAVVGCLGTRDSYGVPCAGQSDAPLALGIIGGVAGAMWIADLLHIEQWRRVQDDRLRPGRP